MNTETYYYGQGKVELAIIAANGTLGPWRWVGDVSAFSPKFSVDKVNHNDSYSGKRALVRSFIIGNTGTIDMTWHQLDAANLAQVLQGQVSDEDEGTFSAQALPADLAVGDTFDLGHLGVSDVVITDSTSGEPVTLVEGTHYSLDANFGTGTLLSTDGITQPLQAAGSYAATRAVGFFATAPSNVALRYRGVNLAENNAPVEAMFYKVTTDPLQELALITTGNDVAGAQITANLLLDSSKPASGALGQFGYIKQLAPAA
jgi:hypothetical protein